jgi:putative spermidine/putrescine transport system ATP-binding protein
VTALNGDTCHVRLDSGDEIDAKPVNVRSRRPHAGLDPARAGRVQQPRPPAGAHTLMAEVREFIYMGDIFRTPAAVAGHDDFIIKTRNAPDQIRHQPGRSRSAGCPRTAARSTRHVDPGCRPGGRPELKTNG